MSAIASTFMFVAAVTNVVHGASSGFLDIRFTAEPESAYVTSDAPVMLNCALDGRAAKLANIRWKKDGDFLNPNTPRTSIYANGSLAISPPLRNYRTNSGPQVEGVYQCLGVIPSVGSILSKKATVRILGPLEPSDLEHEINVFVGETAVFQCIDEDSESLRDLEVQTKAVWYREGDRVTIDGDRTNLLPSGALELINAVKADSGGYHCEVTLVKTGERLWKGPRHVLKIDENLVEAVYPRAPAFVTKPLPVFKGRLGADVTFECAANGWPKPNITWLKGGSTINLGSEGGLKYATIASGSLRILNVAETDAGDYYCRAENNEDSADAPASLQILAEPTFTKTPESVEAREKADAELACSASGHPAPAIVWYKNGEVIVESDYFQIVNGKNLKIFGLLPTDSGVYQCFASNDVGNIQASARVVVSNASPVGTETKGTEKKDEAGKESSEDLSAPRDVEAVVVSDQFISLTWEAPQRPLSGEEAFGYLIFYREHGSDRERAKNTTRPEVLLQNLKPDQAYDIRVVAVSENGTPVGSSSSSQVRTHAVGLEQPDTDGATGLGPTGGRRHHLHHYHGMSVPSGGGGLLGSNGIKQLDLRAVALSSTSIRVEWDPTAIGGPGGGKKEYSLSYMAEDSAEENFLTTYDTFYVFRNLRPYTMYTIWVGTTAAGGARGATNDVSVRTYSDVPSEPPQNFTAEAASSKSIVVRWEPPLEGTANGQITGYKLRYRPKSSNGVARTVTTDAERRLYAVMGLDKSLEYAFRISALTVNGSGPATKWIYASTLENDLREDVVPEAPASIRVRPMPNSIMVMWSPPKDLTIKISGYTIGYGEGLPDTYKQLVDGKQRYYEIQDLKPNTEYVISVRAFNEKGDGQPVYEQVRTRDRSAVEDTSAVAPLFPPVGIKAIVHSETTVVVFWADAGPPSGWRNNGYFGEDRVYTVRYASHAIGPVGKYRYRNTTQMSCMIDDLRPNTRYEFSVRATVGDRQSGWSMVVENSTEEAVPNSPPQDVTIVPSTVDGNGAPALTLNWQPPKKPNGRITGYIIYYTTDESSALSHWALDGVNGDKMSHTISNLGEETTYYFRIQARNRKGNGPHSQTVAFHTGSRASGRLGSPVDVGAATDGSLGSGKRNTDVSVSIVIAVGVGAAVLLILCVSLVIVFVCKRNLVKTRKDEARRKQYGKQRGANARCEKTSDMWMHHDQMELAAMMMDAGNGHSGNNGKRIPTSSSMAGTDLSGGGSLPRRISEFDRKVGTSTSTLDQSRNFGSQYLSKSDLHGLDRSMMTERSSFVAGIAPVGRNKVWGNNNRSRNGPIIVPVEAHPQPPQSLQIRNNEQFEYQQQQQQLQQPQQQQHHFHPQQMNFGVQPPQHHFHQSYAPSVASSSSTTTATAATSPTLPSNVDYMQQHGPASFLGGNRVSSRLDSPSTPTADTSATTISTGDLTQGMPSLMGGGRIMYPRTQFNVPSSTLSSNASTGTSMTGGRAHVTVDPSGHPIGEMINEQAQIHTAPGVHFHQPPVTTGPPGYNLMAATGLSQWPQVVRDGDHGNDFMPQSSIPSSSAMPQGGGILKTFGGTVGGPMCTSSTTSLCQSLPGHRDSTTTSSSLASTPPLPPVVVAQPKQFVRPVIQQNSSPFKRPSFSGAPVVSMPNAPALVRPFGLSTGAGVAGMNAAMMNQACGPGGGSMASSPTSCQPGNLAINVVNPRIAETKAMGLKPAPSTEELTQEMANLEGLIKDLRVMTANQFEIN